MLIELRIQDFAVIDDLSLDLTSGLNALSGETGAGKSIIVGALSLLVGERASSQVVREGAARGNLLRWEMTSLSTWKTSRPINRLEKVKN